MELILVIFLIAVGVVVGMTGGLFYLLRRQGGFRLTEGTHYQAGYHKHAQSDFYNPN
jgi:hypothetical protein